jgi:predicted TIM-barrel fold metal-dependent hydrolase
VDFLLFDADNHYYEPMDAFTRHMDPSLVRKGAQWVTGADGKPRLLFGDRLSRYLGSSPTFDPIARPGVLLEGKGYGELEPIRPEYRNREARLAVMDAQGIESVLLFPTLGVSVEELISDDVEAMYACLAAFNDWLDEDWGFNFRDRILAVPMVSLLDPGRAADVVESLVGRGARAVNLRPGPIGGRSPADPEYDRFWTVISEADVGVSYHAADGPYRQQMAQLWGWGPVNTPERHIPTIQKIIGGSNRAMHDTVAALLYGGVFDRFPKVRVAGVELSGEWARVLVRSIKWAENGGTGRLDLLREHTFVSPFEHEDIRGLIHEMGDQRVLFGSDWPHTDGLANPVTYVAALEGEPQTSVRRIMRDNARAFVGLP